MKYIDIHAHLNFPNYKTDREEVIKRTIDNKMGVINIGTDLKTSREVLDLAHKHKNFYAAVGIHPTESESITDVDSVRKQLDELLNDEKAVSIGECGLDFFRVEGDFREYKTKQIEIFEMQIELAIMRGKPLMVHCRDAYTDVIKILKKYKTRTETKGDELYGRRLFGNFHFFAGSREDVKEILALDFTISFTGVITFAPQYKELVEAVPVDKMHAETDAPFVAPKAFRGKRNEPLYTIEVIRKIAEIKDMNIETLSKQLLINANRVFGIDIN